MNRMVGYCGLDCESCPIHLATIEKDEYRKRQLKVTIAHLLHERYGINLEPDGVTDCDGCRTESGRLFFMCSSCNIKKCARARSLESCAYCSDFACKELEKVLVDDPNARTRLEGLRRSYLT